MSCIPNVASVSEISELFILDSPMPLRVSLAFIFDIISSYRGRQFELFILDSPMPLRVSLAFIFDSISSYRGRQLVEETTVFGEKSRELTIIEDMLRCHTHWQTLIQLLFGRRHDEPQESCFNNQNLRAFVLINELLIPVGQAYHNIKKLKSRFSVAIIKFTIGISLIYVVRRYVPSIRLDFTRKGFRTCHTCRCRHTKMKKTKAEYLCIDKPSQSLLFTTSLFLWV